MATHGGARPGAGRKPKSDKHSGAISEAERRVADRLPTTIDNLELIADGHAPRVEEKWEPAGTVTVEKPALDADGNPIYDTKGNPVTVKSLAFPDKPADELVLVERKVVTPGPDFKANEYLANRILGKPTERHEVTGEDGEPFKVYVGIDVGRV
jgi:hypothetical protein